MSSHDLLGQFRVSPKLSPNRIQVRNEELELLGTIDKPRSGKFIVWRSNDRTPQAEIDWMGFSFEHSSLMLDPMALERFVQRHRIPLDANRHHDLDCDRERFQWLVIKATPENYADLYFRPDFVEFDAENPDF